MPELEKEKKEGFVFPVMPFCLAGEAGSNWDL